MEYTELQFVFAIIWGDFAIDPGSFGHFAICHIIFTSLHRNDKTKSFLSQVPCEFTEYKIAGDPDKIYNKGVKKLILRLADSKATLISEKQLYTFVSFIAEFGGALGLFVGFSFLTLFDLYEMFKRYFKFMNK